MTDQNPSVNWEELRLAAVEARKNSYSPYSKFPVGAAALTTDGRLVAGCNIENASFGMTLCAECSLISDLFRQGGGKLAYFACVDGEGNILMPCGRCRQLLFEHSAPGMQLLTVSGVKDITDVLPDAFGPAQLKEHKHD
jgi:cytidine deaminase